MRIAKKILLVTVAAVMCLAPCAPKASAESPVGGQTVIVICGPDGVEIFLILDDIRYPDPPPPPPPSQK